MLTIKRGYRAGSGQCVALARSQGFLVTGNAKYWPANAKRAGYRVDMTPGVGAIIVTSESARGHVTGKIQQIDGDWAYISEQNYVSLTVTTGWINLKSNFIRAFIHSS